MKVHFLTVDPEYTGQRLDNFLHTRYKKLPKSRLYRIIRKGEVRVNKKRAGPDYKIQGGDIIRMPPITDEPAPAQPTSINPNINKLLKNSILFEDKHLLILNKPSGLAVHGGSGIRLGVIEALRIMYPQEKFLDLAHRLDRETSGCLLIAKRPSILKEVHVLFKENKVSKKYICLVKGRWPNTLHKVDNPLEGKESLSLFKILKHYKQTTLLEVSLETGRNHQIRLHTSQMGYPVVGDDKYGDKEFNKFMKAYGCDRLFLHAEKLAFELSDKKLSVLAPLDISLKNCLDRL